MLRRWEKEIDSPFLGVWGHEFWVITSALPPPQLRQSQTELEKVEEAVNNFRKMM